MDDVLVHLFPPEAPVQLIAADERGLWRADIPALRALHPGLLDFRIWLERGGAEEIAAAHPAPARR